MSRVLKASLERARGTVKGHSFKHGRMRSVSTQALNGVLCARAQQTPCVTRSSEWSGFHWKGREGLSSPPSFMLVHVTFFSF